MTEAVQVALLTSLPPTIAAIGGVLLILKKQAAQTDIIRNAAHTAEKTAIEAKGTVGIVESLVNSRLTEEIHAKEKALARVRELELEIAARYEEGGKS